MKKEECYSSFETLLKFIQNEGFHKKTNFQDISLRKIENTPDFDDFQNRLHNFTKNESSLEKIVMTRKAVYTFSKSNHQDLLNNIFLNSVNKLTNSFLFVFSPSNGTSFISTSPERLYSREREIIYIDSLAGTRGRGKTPKEDKILEEELLCSQKDSIEQEIVTKGISQIVSPLLDGKAMIKKKEVLKLNTLQHLKNTIQGKLKKCISTDMIIKALHPTPAVGGYPHHQAVDYLKRYDFFDRGLYAAPMGILGHHYADFLVGIRSSLISDGKAHLFAGAGIVKSSEAHSEWQEIGLKIDHFERLLRP